MGSKTDSLLPFLPSLAIVAAPRAHGGKRGCFFVAQMKCVLCHSEDTKPRFTVEVSKLATLYKKYYNIGVEHLFPGEHLSLMECGACGLRFYNPPVAGDEAFYNALQDMPFYYVEEKPEFAYALPFFQPGMKVLEVGCGRGVFARKLPKGVDYTGLELSIKAKEMAAKEGIVIHNQPVEEHARQAAGLYDIVFSFQVLEHVPDVHSFLKACVDCVKPGGLMLHGVPSEESYLAVTLNDIINFPPHHCSRWKDDALRSVGRIFNLSLVEIHHDTIHEVNYPYFLQTLKVHSYMKRFGYTFKPIDTGLKAKLWTLLATREANRLAKGYNPEFGILGNGVRAVWRKG